MNSLSEPIAPGLLYKAYCVATSAAAPMLAPMLFLSKRGRIRLQERYGSWGAVGDVAWWFHGASVGEVRGLLPIIFAARSYSSTGSTLLTTTSPTGLERGAGATDYLRLIPLDAPWCVRRALDSVSLKRFVGCETELWPALYYHLIGRGIRCDIVNGRISDYTVERYGRFRSLFEPILSRIERICVPSERQRDRYIALGGRPASIAVTGHTKYDTSPTLVDPEEVLALRNDLFPGEDDSHIPIIVLGSVRPGEEAEWLRAFNKVKANGRSLRLVIAPRHAEKLPYFSEVLARAGHSFCRWSAKSSERREIVLLDVMGKLESVYAVGALAFVGATLVDVGGHNPLEPAMYGTCVAVGPYVQNIREIVDDMRNADGIITLSGNDTIEQVVERVANIDPEIKAIGVRGEQVWKRHRGATQRVMETLIQGLPR